MPRLRLSRRQINARIKKLAALYGHELDADFIRGLTTMVSDVVLVDLIRAIELGNIDLVLRVIGVDPTVFSPMQQTMTNGFNAGGQVVQEALPPRRMDMGVKAVFRFDVRNVRAEQWLSSRSGTLISRITNDIRDGVRARLRAGMERGDNPRRVALDIIGRIDRATGRRVGGIIGLNGPQSQWVNNATNELSGLDKQSLGNYLKRIQRDKRFDSHVNRAINDGIRIPSEIQQKMIGRYTDNLTRLRGSTIGRTEMIEALNRSNWEAFTQAREQGAIKKVSKKWMSAGDDGRTRDSHLLMHGTTVPIEDPFVLDDGSQLMYPGDATLGAAADQIINCRCESEYIVDFFEDVK